jgi:hypothetical protein
LELWESDQNKKLKVSSGCLWEVALGKTRNSLACNPICHFFFFFFFGGTGVWTQGLHLELLHQPLFCDCFSRDRASRTISLGLALNHDPPDLCLLCS